MGSPLLITAAVGQLGMLDWIPLAFRTVERNLYERSVEMFSFIFLDNLL